ncbi:AAA family ATPase [bacterium]|nr:AAA family ATPase [bacterium]
MMSGHRIGLTLGKYAPFHRGHQLVIETALAETDHVIVLIYDCPAVTPVPLPVRAAWIRQLYPQVELLEVWDGPLQVGNTPAIQRMHEAYILALLAGRRITHFYSSEFYGTHMSIALGAVNRQVDALRRQVPIAATQIRQHPYACRHFLHPLVYRDLITNVVLLGAPSTGKTTLAHTLAERFQTVWMPEYGREYWEHHQIERRLTLAQLTEIAERHLEREEVLLTEANQYLFTDTNALTTFIFSQYYHRTVSARLTQLAEQAAMRYDIVFVCDTDIPYDATWDRSGEVNQEVMQQRIRSDLHTRKLPYLLLRGDVDTRVRMVQDILSRYHKYQNLLDLCQ